MRVADGNRLRPGLPAAVRDGIAAHVAWLNERVAELDRLVAAAVRRTPAWRERDRLLRSVPGVGPVAARVKPPLGSRPAPKSLGTCSITPVTGSSSRHTGDSVVNVDHTSTSSSSSSSASSVVPDGGAMRGTSPVGGAVQ